MSVLDQKALEAAQRAYMLASHCGLSLGHERVFCDDARLPDSVRCSPEDCSCRCGASLALEAYFETAKHPLNPDSEAEVERVRSAIRYLNHPETPWSDDQIKAVIEAARSPS
jgi:hypothetical protein